MENKSYRDKMKKNSIIKRFALETYGCDFYDDK